MPFTSFAVARLGAKPLEPFGKGSNALKAGTPDAGSRSLKNQKSQELTGSYHVKTHAAVRSAPGRGRAEGGVIRAGRPEMQGYEQYLGLGGTLDDFGEPNGELGAFADGAILPTVVNRRLSGPF